MWLETQPFQLKQGRNTGPGYTKDNQSFTICVRQRFYIIISIIDDGTAGSQHNIAPANQPFGISSAVPDFSTVLPRPDILRVQVSTADISRAQRQCQIFQDSRLVAYHADLNPAVFF